MHLLTLGHDALQQVITISGFKTLGNLRCTCKTLNASYCVLGKSFFIHVSKTVLEWLDDKCSGTNSETSKISMLRDEIKKSIHGSGLIGCKEVENLFKLLLKECISLQIGSVKSSLISATSSTAECR
jgi:hypothetical protein